jgi:hypothetical protein
VPLGWEGHKVSGVGRPSDQIHTGIVVCRPLDDVLAHEVGHGYGRDHILGCGTDRAGSPLDYNYPFYDEGTGLPVKIETIGEFGVDTPDPGTTDWKIQDPRSMNDFMGYCLPRWVSPYTYRKLFEAAVDRNDSGPLGGDASPMISAAVEEAISIRGRIYTNDHVEIEPPFHWPQRLQPSKNPDSEYLVELSGANGTPLQRAHIPRGHMCGEGEDSPYFDFGFSLPFPDGARTLRILRGEREVFRREISEAPPRVSGVELREAREGARHRLGVSWATDASDRRLWFRVRYSPDGGRTWMGVVPATTERTVELELSGLPGGDECLVEVFASDGMATGRARSRAFVVPHKPPRFVVAPVSSESRSASGTVRLLGAGFDEYGRSLGEARLLWTSDRDGVLGYGAVLERALSPGQHSITLSGTDARGESGKAQTLLSIGPGSDRASNAAS